MSEDAIHLKRLVRFIAISAGVHLVLLVVTSIGWFIHMATKPAEPAKTEAKPAEAAKSEAKAQPAAAPAAPAAAAEPTAKDAGLPPVPGSKDRDSELFGKPETDPKALQAGPDARPDLDALK